MSVKGKLWCWELEESRSSVVDVQVHAVVDSRIEAQQLCFDFDFDMCCGHFVVVLASLTSGG